VKAVILAGGLGTRFAEETETRPKPMIEIGGRPILWHIMRLMAHHDVTDITIALGYKGGIIRDYFHKNPEPTWQLTLADTGEATLTGGRIKRLQPQLGGAPFMVTYGDGVSDVPLDRVIAHHQKSGKLATVTAVRPPVRFGGIVLAPDQSTVAAFTEKSQIDAGWINGGFIVMEPAIFDYLKDDSAILETDLLERLAAEGQLAAYCHHGFWQCMDTLRDRRALQALWDSGHPPWKLW
jgi:glucose-1-phosphate cytidylyltransferase